MPPPHKGTVSGFAAAAKVLFESAQRVGAVEPLEHSTKQYAQHLKKIQSQSKKRGGSLGGVSYKVAEFLAAQRLPAPQREISSSKERTIAKKVPLIEIPRAPGKATLGKSPEDETKFRPPLKPHSTVSSLFPEGTELRIEKVPAPHPSASCSATESAVPSSPSVEEVFITEDKPLFDSRQQVTPQQPVEVFVQPLVAVTKSEEVPTPGRKLKPVISIPIASVGVQVAETTTKSKHGDSENGEAAAKVVDELSVDAWEQLRERELVRLQRKQEEEEQRRLSLLREQEHLTLGKEWVERRRQNISFEAESTVGGKLLRELFATDSASAALVTFRKMIDAGARAAVLLPAGLASVAYKIRAADPTERLELKMALLDAVEKAKLPDHVTRKAHLLVSGSTDFLAAFGALTAEEKQHLDSRTILKALRILIWNERWEQALEFAKESRSNFSSRSDVVDLTLLKASQLLEEGPRKEVVAYATRSLTESGRLGGQAKLLLASTESGVYRRTLLKQLTASSDVDEGVYAELILRSDREQTEVLLAEMGTRGLNNEDPVVLGAVAMKTLSSESPAEAFKEINRQVAKIGIRSFHMRVAAMTAALHPTEEVLRQASAVVQMAAPAARGPGLRKLLPILYQHNMLDEIVHLAKSTNEAVSVAKLIPRAVAFMNEALLNAGLEPLSEVRVSDIGFSRTIVSADPSSSSLVGTQATSVIADIAGLTEKMLLYAKERQWAKALEVVGGLPTSIRADSSAVTLLYNCALGAAVEHPETVKQVHMLMANRKVTVNATTVNTVLSSLSKSTQWKEALEFFHATPVEKRDTNTYLVYLALLGKRNLWKQATEAYDEARAAIPKMPSAMFSLVIGTTCGHDWHATLRIFQDMLRVHGTGVKDIVVTQVIRSLEQNRKTTEIAKLEKELARRKKKKK